MWLQTAVTLGTQRTKMSVLRQSTELRAFGKKKWKFGSLGDLGSWDPTNVWMCSEAYETAVTYHTFSCWSLSSDIPQRPSTQCIQCCKLRGSWTFALTLGSLCGQRIFLECVVLKLSLLRISSFYIYFLPTWHPRTGHKTSKLFTFHDFIFNFTPPICYLFPFFYLS